MAVRSTRRPCLGRKGDGRTSLRASYAFGYDYVAPLWREDYSSAAPWTNAITVNAVPFDDPWRNFPGGNPFPLVAGASAQFLPYTQFQAVPQNIRTPNTSSWNLSLQRQLTSDWLVSANYIGTSATHVGARTRSILQFTFREDPAPSTA